MNRSMNDYLQVATQYLPKELITQSAIERINEVATLLPQAPLVIFESHLGKEKLDLDFLVCTTPDYVLNQKLAPLISNYSAWEKVHKFSQAWQRNSENSLLRQGVDSIWLEFDTTRINQKVVIPGIFFASMEVHANATTSLAEHAEIVWETLDHLSSPATKTALFKTKLTQILQALPKNGRIYALGGMNGRSSENIRIAICNIHPDTLFPFLEKINWPGNKQAIRKIVHNLMPDIDFLNLDFDLGDTLSPMLGIEFTTRHRFQKDWWQTLLEQLVANNLCLPSKRDSLLAWQGYSNETHNHKIWPTPLVNTTHLPQPIYGFMIRFINHIKVVYKPNQPVEAKGYLAMRQTGISQNQLTSAKKN